MRCVRACRFQASLCRARKHKIAHAVTIFDMWVPAFFQHSKSISEMINMLVRYIIVTIHTLVDALHCGGEGVGDFLACVWQQHGVGRGTFLPTSVRAHMYVSIIPDRSGLLRVQPRLSF